jgi:16S rRNA (cytosine1402-N4)-methyltransferase
MAMDRDPAALSFAGERLAQYGKRVTYVHASFDKMSAMANRHGFEQVNGILLDLGLSSRQLDDPTRGFAFRFDGPLDMRLDPDSELTAATLVNESSSEELANLIWRYGEERESRRIAKAIVAARPLATTGELAAVISNAVSRRERSLHPATRTFQALRLAVNQELDAISSALPQAISLLQSGGRLAVIAFHSLEDRIVKQFFRQSARDCICPPEQPICTCEHKATLKILTRKPARPSRDEMGRNPRSRSARLRVAERI